MTATIATLAALAGSFWLLRHDGTWDAYRHAMFLPFLSTAVMMVVFSTTAVAGDREDWRRLVIRLAIGAAVVEALAGALVSRNPILDLHPKDVIVLGVLAALLVAGAGAATECGERLRPESWMRTAWCAAAIMGILAVVPPLLLALH